MYYLFLSIALLLTNMSYTLDLSDFTEVTSSSIDSGEEPGIFYWTDYKNDTLNGTFYLTSEKSTNNQSQTMQPSDSQQEQSNNPDQMDNPVDQELDDWDDDTWPGDIPPIEPYRNPN